MSLSDDDELDGILDSALDGFDVKTKAESSPSAASKPPVPAEELDDASTAEALRAFEAALKPLEERTSGGPDEEEEDMKLITEFIKSFEKLGDGPGSSSASGEGGASGAAGEPPDIENAIKSLIDNVLSKDILQEPMLQIRTSLSAWLTAEGPGLPAADRVRHETQLAIVKDICKEYEEESDPSKVIDLLARLRDEGTLPPAVMRDLPDDAADSVEGTGLPGMPAGMEDLAANCPMQ